MIRRMTFIAAALFLGTGAAVAQRPQAPYAGEQSRDIKALSPQEVEQYLAGAGMGFAKAAELNSYPGPKHALELADELSLTPEQIEQTRRIRAEMTAATQRLGELLVAAEADLDTRFAEGTIDEADLQAATENIAILRGRIRASHLVAHLRLKNVLTSHQVRLYDQLRGYGDGNSPKHGSHH